MNYKIELSYCGTNFHGWAKQPNTRTVEGEIINAFKQLFNINVLVNASGRTDAYVHALNQVINVKHEHLNLNNNDLMKALNSKLPKDIIINNVMVVNDDFHARYHCQHKTYLYVINIKPKFDIFNQNNIYQLNETLDLNKMKEIANYFIGTHNFLSFSTSELNDTIRTIYTIHVYDEHGLIFIKIDGNGFLRSMVRMIVAFMVNYTLDKVNLNDLEDLFKNPIKGKAQYKLPGCGLYLYKVYY